jgi:hypothetical protein
LPVLRVVAGNTLFVGTPGATRHFRDKAAYAAAEEHYNSELPIPKRDKERKFEEAKARGDQVAAHLQSAVDGADSQEVLTLFDCQVWPASGGDGVKVAMVRIPLEAIDGWWPGAGELLKAPGQGGGWLMGFGVVFPVED